MVVVILGQAVLSDLLKDDNERIDEQKFGLAAKATEYNEIKTLAFESTS